MDINWELQKAAIEIELEKIKSLIDRGADVNTTRGDAKGQTPLHRACSKKQMSAQQVIEYLVEKGAMVDAEDQFGNTPLLCASEKSCLTTVKYLLMLGANIDQKNSDGYTALHLADGVEILRMFLDNGLDINGCSNYGDTPLHMAAMRGNLECVKLLLEIGADDSILNNKNETALEVAEERDNFEITDCIETFRLAKHEYNSLVSQIDLNSEDNIKDKINF